MSKGLEALGILCNAKQECSFECSTMCNNCQKNEAKKIIEKELKALEIIKKKRVDVGVFMYFSKCGNSVELWNELYIRSSMTQEEYDLLKEVLL